MTEKDHPASNNDDSLEEFARAKYLLIETFRKNGDAVRTPVFFAIYNGFLYISTPSRTGKAKRIRRNDNVRIAPTDFRGRKIKGEWRKAKARLVDDPALVKLVNSLLYKQHPFLRRLRALIDLFERPKRLFFSIEIVNADPKSTAVS